MSSKLDKNKIFSGMATEHTLKEVVDAVKSINLNVGDIVVGDIAVESSDTITHTKLDVLNTTLTNKTLNKTTSSIDISGQRVDISGQRVDISGQRVNISGQMVDISGQRVLTDISGQRVDISGQRVDISGQRVDISGQRVDISGQRVLTDISGQRVDISGQRVLTDISGQRVLTDISGQMVDISGQRVLTDISGQRVDISGQRVLTDISGQTVDISGQRVLTDISGQRVDISGQFILVDISGSRVDISGQRVLTDISGQRVLTDISGQRVLTDISGQTVDISGQRVLTDISGQRVLTDISGQRVITDISGQRVDISGQRVLTDISGQRVDISGQRVLTDISGQRVLTDISGQTVDISGQSVRVVSMPTISVSADISGQSVRVLGYDGVSAFNNLYVDANGFISANVLSTAHENIYLGFDTYYADYCSGSSNVGIWSKNNPNASNVDGWYCSSPASTNEVSIYTYLNHFFGAYNQSNFTFGDIDTWYCVMQNWNCVNNNTMPYVRVHSATSRWDYTIDAGQPLNNGEAIMPYFGLLSRIKTNDTEVRRVKYSLTGGAGPRSGTENITKIELYIPNTVSEFIEMNVIEGAVYVKNKGLINYYYTNNKDGRMKDDINEIRKQTDKLTFKTTTNELKVDVSGQRVDVSGQRVDISGQDVRTKGMWLNTELQHMNNPAALGDPNIIKSADGAMSSYINGATNVYDVYTNKLNSGNMAPINTVQTEYDSTAGFYRQSLCVKDVETYKAMTNGGIVVGGKNASNSFRTLRLDDNGKIDISGQGMLLNAYSRTDGANRVATLVQPAGSVSTARALETYSYMVGLSDNIILGQNVPMQITSTTGNSTQSLDTYIRNPTTQNDYTKVGLNTYQIYPKKIYCNFGGYNGAATANLVYGGPTNNAMTPTTINFNSVSTLYYWVQNGTSIGTRKYYFKYVDLNNTLQSGDITISGTGYNPLLGIVGAPIGMRSLLSFESRDYIPISVNVNIVVATSTATPTNNNNCIGGLTYHSTFNGAIVVPSGYIGYLTQFSFYANASTAFNYIKYYTGADAGQSTGFTGRTTLAQYNNASNFTVANGGEPIGGIIEPGEGVIMYKQTATTDTYFMGTFVLEAV